MKLHWRRGFYVLLSGSLALLILSRVPNPGEVFIPVLGGAILLPALLIVLEERRPGARSSRSLPAGTPGSEGKYDSRMESGTWSSYEEQGFRDWLQLKVEREEREEREQEQREWEERYWEARETERQERYEQEAEIAWEREQAKVDALRRRMYGDLDE